MGRLVTAPLPCGPTPDDARVARDGFDVDALYVALDRKRRGQRQRWRDVAAEVGVSPSTFSRMAHGANPDVPGLAKMLAWLGSTDLAPYLRVALRRPDAETRDRTEETL